jgi:hypothetical protein
LRLDDEARRFVPPLGGERVKQERSDEPAVLFRHACGDESRRDATLKPKLVAGLAFDKLKDEDIAGALSEAKEAYSVLGSTDQAAKGPELLKKLQPEEGKQPS